MEKNQLIKSINKFSSVVLSVKSVGNPELYLLTDFFISKFCW